MNGSRVPAAVETLVGEMSKPNLKCLFDKGQDGCFTAKWAISVLADVRDEGLSPLQFAALQFCKGNRLGNHLGCSEGEIREATKSALEAARNGCDRKAMEPFREKGGLNVSTGSAILTWVIPKQYAIYDTRVQAALRSFGLRAPRPYGAFSFYCEEYLPIVRNTAVRVKRTPQEVDVWLYNHSGGT